MSRKPLPAEELEKAVIGIVGKDARPLSPGEKSMMGFRRDLYGVTDELRRHNRRRVLTASPEDIQKTAERLLDRWDSGVSVLLAGDALAKSASRAFPELSGRLEIPF